MLRGFESKMVNVISIEDVGELHNVRRMELLANKDGQPILSVWDDYDALSIFYNFPLVSASEVIICNEFLRSLDLDIEITFESYRQYDKLIQSIFELLEQKQKAIA